MKKYICPSCNSRCNQPYCNECERTIPSNSYVEVKTKEIEKEHYCNYCGSKVVGNKTNCPYCGELMFKGSNDKKYHYSNSYFLNYIFSILIPLVGIIMGAIYLTREDEKDVGAICILLGIISTIIYSIIAFV